MTQHFCKMMSSINGNKRKGRMNPNSNKLGRPKFYSDKNMPSDGIYSNSKVMYAGASLVGCVVQIQVQNGAVYEGVLKTFSHQLDIVLETAHKVNVTSSPKGVINPVVSNLVESYPFEGGLHDKMIFRLSDIVLMQACGVDADYAVKDHFTDTAISRFNGQVKERELEPWEGAGSDSETSLTLTMEDEDGTNGWDANDMFKTNAEKYGVKSSYDNSLQEYTVPLTKKDTEEYKLQEARALRIAQEIETNSSYQSRLQLENGDEEDRFSAVVRPAAVEDTAPSKYVLPQKRRNTPGLKRQVSTTSSPVHHQSSAKPYTTAIPPGTPTAPFSNDTSPAAVTMPGPKNGATNKTLTPADETVIAPDISPAEPPIPEPVTGVPVPSKMQVLGPPPLQTTLPPRIERRRENEKKFAKQKGRMDEIEDFKKFSKNFNVLTEEKEPTEVLEEVFPESKVETTTSLASKLERVKLEKDEDKSADMVKFSTLNPNAKEFVFNPNAKSFTPRSMPTVAPPPVQAPPPTPPQQRLQQDPTSVVQQQVPPPPQQQMVPHHQPLFTAVAPQYIMQAPVASIASPFAAANPVPQQTPRFRKASGQPLLAPSQLTVQYAASPPGAVIHASGPPQPGYPHMNFVVGPRVVSPQPVGVIPTSHSVSYCDASHIPGHLFVSAGHPGANHSSTQHHSLQTQHHHQQQQQQGQQQQHSNHHHHHHHHHHQHHPPQSQTPVPIHPAPSPVHSQPPTPTTVMYPQHHPLQQPMMPHQHHPGFGSQHLVLMHQPQHPSLQQHHHHPHPMHHQQHHSLQGHQGHLLPQMTILPTSAAALTSVPSSIATPPYVQHP